MSHKGSDKGTGILLITHDKIGTGILATAAMILQKPDLPVGLLEAPADCCTEEKTHRAKALIQQLDNGQGVLILNDIYGATPFNIAKELVGERVMLLSGLNLNMLLRAINYRERPLSEVAEKAREGGLNGVRYGD